MTARQPGGAIDGFSHIRTTVSHEDQNGIPFFPSGFQRVARRRLIEYRRSPVPRTVTTKPRSVRNNQTRGCPKIHLGNLIVRLLVVRFVGPWNHRRCKSLLGWFSYTPCELVCQYSRQMPIFGGPERSPEHFFNFLSTSSKVTVLRLKGLENAISTALSSHGFS